MKPAENKLVALADTRWGGHHPTYLREFTASLLRLGARVILLCRRPEEIIGSLPDEESRARVTPVVFDHPNHGFFSRKRDHDPLSTLSRWLATGKAIHEAEESLGQKVDLVFFPYLDSYIRFAPFPKLPVLTLGRPWSGLYFRNAHLEPGHPGASAWWKRAAKGDRILEARDCRGICVLDERFNDHLQTITRHRVHAFPDMTDESPPEGPTDASREILAKAKGRKIIGLIAMEKRKGLLTLLRAAAIARRLGEPWYFVGTGPFARVTFTEEDITFCEETARAAASGEIDNLHLDLKGSRIQDGVPYNTLFSTFDVVWAAYEDFEGSSNALTKAAIFRKPLVATAGQCVGARVEKHQLGRVFPQGDPAAAVEAIRGALALRSADGSPLRPAFEDYQCLHSRERLDEIFGRLLGNDA
jgi:glycosyltransferase involved in cell wall biosynthesis